MSIRVGIFGYGNLGRGIESAIMQNNDMELVAVFTRREPSTVKINTEGAMVCSAHDVEKFVGEIDVMIICGGSATDLPRQTPDLAKHFTVIGFSLWRIPIILSISPCTSSAEIGFIKQPEA